MPLEDVAGEGFPLDLHVYPIFPPFQYDIGLSQPGRQGTHNGQGKGHDWCQMAEGRQQPASRVEFPLGGQAAEAHEAPPAAPDSFITSMRS